MANRVTNRFFELLRALLFPRLIRETRRFRGLKSRAQPTVAEHELLMGLHGSIFYIGLRRWVYSQAVHSQSTQAFDPEVIRNQVRGYLQSSLELVKQVNAANASAIQRKHLKESPPWH